MEQNSPCRAVDYPQNYQYINIYYRQLQQFQQINNNKRILKYDYLIDATLISIVSKK
jgi:hypothetical protein